MLNRVHFTYKASYLRTELAAAAVALAVLVLVRAVVELPELTVSVDYSVVDMTDVVQSRLPHCSSQAATTVHKLLHYS